MRGVQISAPPFEIRVEVVAGRVTGAEVVEAQDVAAAPTQAIGEHAIQTMRTDRLAAKSVAQHHADLRRGGRGTWTVDGEESTVVGTKIERDHRQIQFG